MRGALLLALVLMASEGTTQDCAYRPWVGSVTPWANKTFATILGTGTNYDASLWNDWAYYRGLSTPDPPALTPPWYTHYRYLRTGLLVTQYYQQTHTPQAGEAVIVVHGSSLYPDAWFSDAPVSQVWGGNYTNFGGSSLFADGYDVFAPYVTHHGSLNAALRRVANAYGDEVYSIEVRRALALFDHLKAQGYTRIHLVGISYGGWIVVETARTLSDPVRGVVLAVEGWLPSRVYVENGMGGQPALFQSGWEMSFTPTERFLDVPPGVQVAYGSCNAPAYAAPYSALPAEQVITYTGAHEFLMSVWDEARARTP